MKKKKYVVELERITDCFNAVDKEDAIEQFMERYDVLEDYIEAKEIQ